MMIVEKYTDKYRHDVVRLTREFYDEALSVFGQPLVMTALYEAVEKYKPHVFVLLKDGACVGLLAGYDVVVPLNHLKLYHTIIWFIRAEHRAAGMRLLLRQVYKTLKSEGYSSIVMTALYNGSAQKMTRLYERLGFQPLEKHFIKQL